MDVGRDTKMKAETDIYAVQRKLCIVANGWPGASLPFVRKRGTAGPEVGEPGVRSDSALPTSRQGDRRERPP